MMSFFPGDEKRDVFPFKVTDKALVPELGAVHELHSREMQCSPRTSSCVPLESLPASGTEPWGLSQGPCAAPEVPGGASCPRQPRWGARGARAGSQCSLPASVPCSRTEALPPAGNERHGVHPGHPHPPHQSGQGLRPESPDQRTGKV